MPRYMQGKVIYPMYYKKCAYPLAQKTHFVCFSLFWPPKSILWSRNLQFSNFYVNQLFIAEAAIYRNSNFVLILHMKVWKNHPQKCNTLAKLQKCSILPWCDGQICLKTKRYKVYLIFMVLGMYNFDARFDGPNGNLFSQGFLLLRSLCFSPSGLG